MLYCTALGILYYTVPSYSTMLYSTALTKIHDHPNFQKWNKNGLF